MIRAAKELSHHRSRLPLLGLVAVLAAGVLGAGWYYLRASGGETGSLERLARIVGPHRVTRARLSGGFKYVACQSDSSRDRLLNGLVCGSTPAASWSSAERLGRFAEELRAGRRGSATRDAHTAGVWNLVWGRVDDAIAELREAVRLDPLNASALNDLAVALTDYAEAHDDPSSLVDAFVAADSAVRADSTLKEARFTHALLLEKLYLSDDARAAWNRYLQIDGRSQWADEARKHAALLEPPSKEDDTTRLQRAIAKADSQTIKSVVAHDPAAARMFVEKELGNWGTGYAVGAPAAAAHLAAARAVSRPLFAATNDALWSDAVASIDQALAKNDSVRTRALSDGHVALERGIVDFEKFDPKANTDFKNAQIIFAKVASPMAGWALFYMARAGFFQNQDSALKWLTAIRDSAPPQYLSLRSMAAQYEGLAFGLRSDYLHTLASYDSAVTENATTREPNLTLRVGSWLSQIEDQLRGREAGWRTRYAVLAASPHFPTSYQGLYTAFDVAGQMAASDSPRLALRYCEQAIRFARKLPGSTTPTLAYALRRRAELLAKLGQLDSARAEITAALKAAADISDSLARPQLVAEITLSSEHIALQSAPAGGEERLRRVVDKYVAMKYDRGLASAYLYLAQAQAAAGSIEPARAAFDSATNVMQRQRATVSALTERGAFLDDARSVIDQIVAFHADHNKEDAFEYFEGTRSRVLLEQLAGSDGRATDQHRMLKTLQSRLAKDDVVLSYAVLPHELLVWLIGRDRFEQRRTKIEAPELEGLINRFQRSVVETTTEPDVHLSEQLYRLLVDSTGDSRRWANLFVIPDRWIHFVPFAALRDPASGHFLVYDHAVSYAPSATLLLSSLVRPRQRFSRSSKVLAVGNPAFDRRTFQLPDLPSAEIEARRIASLYTNQNPLIGRDATDTALERLAPGFDILHFAGHAIVGRDAPQLSHLVLASDGKSGGAIFSTDIARWKLSQTGLVVLSGCNTADGKLSATEGASSLARAFFAAGVPAVLSSLWAIEDDATADFFIAFHRRLADGDSPAVALRETQIKFMNDGRAPARPVRSWAAFQLFGG